MSAFTRFTVTLQPSSTQSMFSISNGKGSSTSWRHVAGTRIRAPGRSRVRVLLWLRQRRLRRTGGRPLGDAAEARRGDRHAGPGDGCIQLRPDRVGLVAAAQAVQALVVPVQAPDVVGMLA